MGKCESLKVGRYESGKVRRWESLAGCQPAVVSAMDESVNPVVNRGV